MDSRQTRRRRFLKNGAALAGLAATAAMPTAGAEAAPPDVHDMNSLDAVLYGQRSRFVKTVRLIDPMQGDLHGGNGPRPDPFRAAADTPLRESVGIITPTSLHYTTQHNYGIPDIDPEEHRLTVHGMVDRPLVFTMEELKRLPSISRIYFIECIANMPNARLRNVDRSHGKTGCSEWTGVPLSLLLREAGVQSGAGWVIAEGAEGGKHIKSVPMAKAMEDVLVAYGQNGEPVRPDHGYPLRLVVPGCEGIYNVKWLSRIKVVDRPYLSYWESSRFMSADPKSPAFTLELGPKSVITFPSGDQQLRGPGFYTITGLAWSGGGAIRKVEVSTDNGGSWQEAQLQSPVLSRAHTRFNFDWRWNGDETVLQSRCTDELGQVQPSQAQFDKFWGKTRSAVTSVGHVNFIQPWRVTRDGRVHNAL